MTNTLKTTSAAPRRSKITGITTCTCADPVSQYLDEIGEYPNLSAEEESAIAHQLQDLRRRLRRVLLANHFMLTAAAEALLKVCQGKLRADRVLDTTVFDTAAYRQTTSRLPQIVWRLQRLVDRNRRDAGRLCAFAAGRFGWQPYAQRLKARCREAATLVWDARLRLKMVFPRWRQLAAISERMLRLEESLQLPSGELPESRAELAEFIALTGMRPRALARWIALTTALMARYETLKHRLARHNLRLVVSIAKRYGRKGPELLDLIQEGNAGLTQATDKFEPRGFRFTTYATWWIKNSVWESLLERDRTIALPRDKTQLLRRLHKTRTEWLQQHGRAPTLEEEIETCSLTAQDTELLAHVGLPLVSLDLAEGETEGPLGELIEDARHYETTSEADRAVLSQLIQEILGGLTERERQVIEFRFALAGGKPRTLDEAGSLLGLSGERVRQIERRAVEKLRRSKHRASLQAFME